MSDREFRNKILRINQNFKADAVTASPLFLESRRILDDLENYLLHRVKFQIYSKITNPIRQQKSKSLSDYFSSIASVLRTSIELPELAPDGYTYIRTKLATAAGRFELMSERALLEVEEYRKAGRIWHYFGYVDPKLAPVRTLLEKRKPTPIGFEGNVEPTSLVLYPKWIDSNGINPDYRGIAPFQSFGYTKKQLQTAILESGIIEKIVTKKGRTYEREGLTITDEASTIHRIPKTIFGNQVEAEAHSYEKYLPGFGKNPYKSKSYYEAIYRFLFRTTSKMNWRSICSGRTQLSSDLNLLRFLAIQDFDFDSSVLEKDEKEICRMIIEKLDRDKAIAEEAIEIREPLLYQPSESRLEERSGAWNEPYLTAKYVKPEDQELYNLCAGNGSLEEIKFIAIRMGFDPKMFRDKTRSEICSYLINYLER